MPDPIFWISSYSSCGLRRDISELSKLVAFDVDADAIFAISLYLLFLVRTTCSPFVTNMSGKVLNFNLIFLDGLAQRNSQFKLFLKCRSCFGTENSEALSSLVAQFESQSVLYTYNKQVIKFDINNLIQLLIQVFRKWHHIYHIILGYHKSSFSIT